MGDLDRAKFLQIYPSYQDVEQDDSNPEPRIIGVAGCKQDIVQIDNGSEELDSSDIELHKNDFGVFIIAWDFVTIIILLWFANFLDKRQKEYTTRFSDETIEMTDFGMRFQNMPKNKYFGGNQTKLRNKLWSKFS